MLPNLKKIFSKGVFQQIVEQKFQILEDSDQKVYQYNRAEEQSTLKTMSDCSVLLDVSLQS